MQLLLILACLVGTILSTSTTEPGHNDHTKPKVAIDGYVNGYYTFLGRHFPVFFDKAHTAISGIEIANEQTEIPSTHQNLNSHSEGIAKSSLLLNHQHAEISKESAAFAHHQERLKQNPLNSVLGSSISDLEVFGHGPINLAPVTENNVEKAIYLNNNHAGRVMDTDHIGSINSYQTNVYSSSRTPILGMAGLHDYRGEAFHQNNEEAFGTLTGMNQVDDRGNMAGGIYSGLGLVGNVYAENQNSYTRGANYGDSNENQIFTGNQNIGRTAYKDSASMSQASGGAATQNTVVHTFVDYPVHYTSQLSYKDERLHGTLGLKDHLVYTNHGEPPRFGQASSAWSLENDNQMNLNPSVENTKQVFSDGKSINHQTSKVVEKENVVTFSNSGAQNSFQSIANSQIPTITDKRPFDISRWMDHVQNKGIINQNFHSKFGVTDQADKPKYFLDGNTGILDHNLYLGYGHGSRLDMNQINNMKGSILQEKTKETFDLYPNYYSQMDNTNSDFHNPNVYVDEAYHRSPKVTNLEGSYLNTGSVKNGEIQNKNMYFGQTGYDTDQINQRGTVNSKVYQETLVSNPESVGVTKQNNFNGNLYFNGNGLDSMGVQTNYGEREIVNTVHGTMGGSNLNQDKTNWNLNIGGAGSSIPTGNFDSNYVGIGQRSGSLGSNRGNIGQNQYIDQTNYETFPGTSQVNAKVGTSNQKKVSQTVISYPNYGRIDKVGTGSDVTGLQVNQNQNQAVFPSNNADSEFLVNTGHYPQSDSIGRTFLQGVSYGQYPMQEGLPSQFPLWGTLNYPFENRPTGKYYSNIQYLLQDGVSGHYPLQGDPLQSGFNIQHPSQIGLNSRYYPQNNINVRYPSQVGINGQFYLGSSYPIQGINVYYSDLSGQYGQYPIENEKYLNPVLWKQLLQDNQDWISVSSRINQDGSDHASPNENVGQKVEVTHSETIETEKQTIHAKSESGTDLDETKPIHVENTVKIFDATTSVNGEAEPIPIGNTVKIVNTTTSINETSEKYIAQKTSDETPDHMLDEHHTTSIQQPYEKKGIQVNIDSSSLTSNGGQGEAPIIDLSPRFGINESSKPADSNQSREHNILEIGTLNSNSFTMGLVNKTKSDGGLFISNILQSDGTPAIKVDSAMKLNVSDHYQMSLVGSLDNEVKPTSYNKEVVDIGVTKGTNEPGGVVMTAEVSNGVPNNNEDGDSPHGLNLHFSGIGGGTSVIDEHIRRSAGGVLVPAGGFNGLSTNNGVVYSSQGHGGVLENMIDLSGSNHNILGGVKMTAEGFNGVSGNNWGDIAHALNLHISGTDGQTGGRSAVRGEVQVPAGGFNILSTNNGVGYSSQGHGGLLENIIDLSGGKHNILGGVELTAEGFNGVSGNNGEGDLAHVLNLHISGTDGQTGGRSAVRGEVQVPAGGFNILSTNNGVGYSSQGHGGLLENIIDLSGGKHNILGGVELTAEGFNGVSGNNGEGDLAHVLNLHISGTDGQTGGRSAVRGEVQVPAGGFNILSTNNGVGYSSQGHGGLLENIIDLSGGKHNILGGVELTAEGFNGVSGNNGEGDLAHVLNLHISGTDGQTGGRSAVRGEVQVPAGGFNILSTNNGVGYSSQGHGGLLENIIDLSGGKHNILGGVELTAEGFNGVSGNNGEGDLAHVLNLHISGTDGQTGGRSAVRGEVQVPAGGFNILSTNNGVGYSSQGHGGLLENIIDLSGGKHNILGGVELTAEGFNGVSGNNGEGDLAHVLNLHISGTDGQTGGRSAVRGEVQVPAGGFNILSTNNGVGYSSQGHGGLLENIIDLSGGKHNILGGVELTAEGFNGVSGNNGEGDLAHVLNLHISGTDGQTGGRSAVRGEVQVPAGGFNILSTNNGVGYSSQGHGGLLENIIDLSGGKHNILGGVELTAEGFNGVSGNNGEGDLAHVLNLHISGTDGQTGGRSAVRGEVQVPAGGFNILSTNNGVGYSSQGHGGLLENIIDLSGGKHNILGGVELTAEGFNGVSGNNGEGDLAHVLNLHISGTDGQTGGRSAVRGEVQVPAGGFNILSTNNGVGYSSQGHGGLLENIIDLSGGKHNILGGVELTAEGFNGVSGNNGEGDLAHVLNLHISGTDGQTGGRSAVRGEVQVPAGGFNILSTNNGVGYSSQGHGGLLENIIDLSGGKHNILGGVELTAEGFNGVSGNNGEGDLAHVLNLHISGTDGQTGGRSAVRGEVQVPAGGFNILSTNNGVGYSSQGHGGLLENIIDLSGGKHNILGGVELTAEGFNGVSGNNGEGDLAHVLNLHISGTDGQTGGRSAVRGEVQVPAGGFNILSTNNGVGYSSQGHGGLLENIIDLSGGKHNILGGVELTAEGFNGVSGNNGEGDLAHVLNLHISGTDGQTGGRSAVHGEVQVPAGGFEILSTNNGVGYSSQGHEGLLANIIDLSGGKHNVDSTYRGGLNSFLDNGNDKGLGGHIEYDRPNFFETGNLNSRKEHEVRLEDNINFHSGLNFGHSRGLNKHNRHGEFQIIGGIGDHSRNVHEVELGHHHGHLHPILNIAKHLL